jgi:hypothetical protein
LILREEVMLSAQVLSVVLSEFAPQTTWREGFRKNVAKRAWDIVFSAIIGF